MPVYTYIAVDTANRKHKGTLEAENENRIKTLLRQRQLILLRLTKREPSSLIQWWQQRYRFRQWSPLVTVTFIRQLATLLAAGLPVTEALMTLAAQTHHTLLKAFILALHRKVSEGHSLAAALRDAPRTFSPLLIESIAAGEKSGQLEAVLTRLAHYTENTYHTHQKIQTALIYPIAVLFLSMLIVGFLLAYVVPKMVAVYIDANQTLPWLTRLLIHISYFMQHFGGYLVGLLLLTFSSIPFLFKRYPGLQKKYHYYLLCLPGIRYLIQTMNTAQFSQTFAMLSQSGVPVIEAIQIARTLVSNLVIRQAIEQAEWRIREGMSIHLALKQTQYFSPMSIHMIASGEASGTLEAMLMRVAEQQENELSRLTAMGLALFEPAMIVTMGGVVLFIVLAVLLPIFQLNQLV